VDLEEARAGVRLEEDVRQSLLLRFEALELDSGCGLERRPDESEVAPAAFSPDIERAAVQEDVLERGVADVELDGRPGGARALVRGQGW
jgi:hypothetical protein